MPRKTGSPDFSTKNLSQSVTGNGDEASRLLEGRGMAGFYPNGRWLYHDDMSGAVGNRWKSNASISGSGATIAQDATFSFRQNQSLKMTSGTVVGTDYWMTKQFMKSVYGMVGLDFMIYMQLTNATHVNYKWRMHFYSTSPTGSASQGTAQLQFDYTITPSPSLVFQYQIQTGYVTFFSNVNFNPSTVAGLNWHNVKMVVDPATMTYNGVVFDGLLFPFPTLPVLINSSVGTAPVNFLTVDMSVGIGGGTLAENVNIEDLILTDNEPSMF